MISACEYNGNHVCFFIIRPTRALTLHKLPIQALTKNDPSKHYPIYRDHRSSSCRSGLLELWIEYDVKMSSQSLLSLHIISNHVDLNINYKCVVPIRCNNQQIQLELCMILQHQYFSRDRIQRRNLVISNPPHTRSSVRKAGADATSA